MVRSDPRVDGSRANAPVAEVVLDHLEAYAGIEHVRRDRVAEAMAGQVAAQACKVAVASEQRLDLALPKRARATAEQRRRSNVADVDVATQQGRATAEKHLLVRDAVL